jgi:hypothetical protein
MDPWFVLFIVLAGITALFLVPVVVLTKKSKNVHFRIALGVGIFLSMLTFFLSSFTVVGAKQIGVPVTFGKPSGDVMHNGWNWKNPATDVHIFDGSLQTEKFSSDKDDQGDPIAVRLFIGSVAHVNVTFQWKLENDNNVKQIFLNYKNPDNINVNLVKRALQQSLNDVFSTYNPYSALISAQAQANGDNTPGTQQVSTTFEDLQTQALSKLTAELGNQGVTAVTLTISSIEYDAKTQANLDALGTAITQTQIALQNEKTAAAQAKSNQLLNANPASGTTVTQLCIQATQRMIEDGHQLPTGWNCFGPSNVPVTTK